MHIERRYTKSSPSPYALIAFETTKSEIRNPDGSVVFSLDRIEVPAGWSQVAADVLAQKYFRKAGVPARLKRVEENGVPSFLWRSVPDEAALEALPKAERFGSETSARQVFDRLAGAWAYWGWKGGYFDAEEDARAYFDETRFMLARQMAAPNSPQWFNTGLHWAYGVDGPGQGHYYVDFETGKLTKSKSAYEHPQPHACFIQSVADDLVNEGGIMDLWVREARLFKYGSGTGSNFSELRGENEKLSGGGRSSGLMSLPQDRRSRGGRDQVGRHDAPRRQDGGRRRRSSRHRGLHRLEGEGGAEGRRAGGRLQDRQAPSQGDPQGLRQLRGPGRRLLRHREEPRAQARGEAGAARRRARRHHQARHPVRAPGLHAARIRHLRHRLGVGGLSDRLRPELQQFGARHRRLPARGGDGRGMESDPPARRQGRTRR